MGKWQISKLLDPTVLSELRNDYAYLKMSKEDYKEIERIHDEELSEVTQSFFDATNRVSSLTSLVSQCYYTAQLEQHCIDKAAFDTTGSLIVPNKETEQWQAFEINFRNNSKENITTLSNRSESEIIDILMRAADSAEIHFSDDKWQTITSWLEAIVVCSWATIEALCGDLWVAAVNLCPTTLGENAIKARRRNNEDDISEDVGEADPKNQIKLETLKRYNYNLSNSIGTMIREQRKFSFNKLSGIRSAYLEVFGKRSDVSKQFEGKLYNLLTEAEAMRHVIVHRNGIADSDFILRMKNSTRYSSIKIKDKLMLNGEDVARITKSVPFFAGSLVRQVAKYILDYRVQNQESRLG